MKLQLITSDLFQGHMINLLFISDIQAVERSKQLLQQSLKIIIDVAADFDSGLREVFEKRPALVCIQDQIGGVTGESVARHIKMLLGSGAPKFILMNSGKYNAKMISGLFEKEVHTANSLEAMSLEILETVESLLGDQWGKIYIPPVTGDDAGSAVPEVPADPVEDQTLDKLVSVMNNSGFSTESDRNFSDIENSEFSMESFGSGFSGFNGSLTPSVDSGDQFIVHSSTDDLAELQRIEKENSNSFWQPTGGAELYAQESVKPTEPAISAIGNISAGSEGGFADRMPQSAAAAADLPILPPVASSAAENVVRSSPSSAAGQPNPAGWSVKVSSDQFSSLSKPAESRFKSIFLQRRWLLLAMVLLLAVLWLLTERKSGQVVDSLLKNMFSVFEAAPKAATVVNQGSAPVQKPLSTAVALPTPAATLIPTFVPLNGHDPRYALANPGWERYVGDGVEFRLFSVSGRVKAVQVIATLENGLPDVLLPLVLKELAGTTAFKIVSTDIKSGIKVENGIISGKGDIQIYRKGRIVRGLVVSINY